MLTRLAALILSAGIGSMAADLSGTWTGSIPARNNEVQDLTFRLVQSGETLTGKLYRDTTSVPILEGTVTEGRIRFRVFSEEQVGNIFLVIKYTFTGTVKGNDIELTREREADPVLRPNNPNNRVNQKPTFTLTRLF
jgi:hypothetical protein